MKAEEKKGDKEVAEKSGDDSGFESPRVVNAAIVKQEMQVKEEETKSIPSPTSPANAEGEEEPSAEHVRTEATPDFSLAIVLLTPALKCAKLTN